MFLALTQLLEPKTFDLAVLLRLPRRVVVLTSLPLWRRGGREVEADAALLGLCFSAAEKLRTELGLEAGLLQARPLGLPLLGVVVVVVFLGRGPIRLEVVVASLLADRLFERHLDGDSGVVLDRGADVELRPRTEADGGLNSIRDSPRRAGSGGPKLAGVEGRSAGSEAGGDERKQVGHLVLDRLCEMS